MGLQHKAREVVLQALYHYDVSADKEQIANFYWLEKKVNAKIIERAKEVFLGAVAHLDEIDSVIGTGIKKWDPDRVGKTEWAIMRLSVYSFLYEKKIDVEVLMNEAVILAKKFCDEDSFKFINGVLNGVFKKTKIKVTRKS